MCRTCLYYETCRCPNCGRNIMTEYLKHDRDGYPVACAHCTVG